MRTIVLVVLSVAAAVGLATNAHAGRIFGDISFGGKPVSAGTRVVVSRAGGAADTTETDKFGSYKLLVKEEGKATLRVVYEKTPLEIAVFSNKEATRYDLVIEKKDGKLSLRRK